MTVRPVGELLRDWRQRRHLSQMDLAVGAGVSTRHLSFLETGRSRPSREMVLHLADHLDVPLRERNTLLLAAGYAPAFPERSLDDPAMASIRSSLEVVLEGHTPYPALIVDRTWHVLMVNRASDLLVEGVAPWLLEPPVNALRVTLHPEGLGRRVANMAEYSGLLLARLRRHAEVTGDDDLSALHDELAGYPGVATDPPAELLESGAVAVPLRLRTGEVELFLYTTIATFGTALDVTLAELSLEAFLPGDSITAEVLQRRGRR